jgi:hypothetical protein
MCISVFSEKKTIIVKYASESVWLNKKGMMEVVADLLIENESNEAIYKLYCIVPQKLLLASFKRIQTTNKNTKLFEDITEDIISQNSKYNSPQGYNIGKISAGKIPVNLEISKANDPSANQNYSGIYYGNNKMTAWTEIDEISQEILSSFRLSVFEINLDHPIQKNEPRWFRWRFVTLTGPLQVRDNLKWFTDGLLNNLFYNYNVSGPGKVLQFPKKLLDTFKTSILAAPNNLKIDNAVLMNSYIDLYEKLINSKTNHPETKVLINDWRTRFYIRTLDLFSSIQIEGDTIPSGGQLNVAHSTNEKYYEWKTGKFNIKDQNGKDQNSNDQNSKIQNGLSGIFTIRLLTKYSFPLLKLLPYFAVLAFILSLINFIINFF